MDSPRRYQPWWATGVGVATLLLTAGCGDNGPAANQNTNQPQCVEGYRADGPACVPIFDDPDSCGAPNEMPVLGGGCRAVGVTQCATGFLSDGEGGCEPILPTEPCPPGTMERIGQTECQPVGVTQCAEGFVPDGEGGCDAILPAEECPPGTIEVIGYDTCQPLGDCGPEGSPWGLIAVDETTVYVDASADATGADGTDVRPYPTITAALAAVEPGGQVAIAAGEYEEVVTLDRPVRLVGRCSALVTLRGRMQIQPRPALRITSGGTGSEVRGVTLTGPGEGLQVNEAQLIVVEGTEVRGTGGIGIVAINGAETMLNSVKVSNCTTAGILSQDSNLRAERTIVAETGPEPSTGLLGRGIQSSCTEPGRCGSLAVMGSLVDRNLEVGLIAIGVDATVASSVVRNTLPQDRYQTGGGGIVAQCDPEVVVCGSLSVESCVVSGNRHGGIYSSGVVSTVRSSVVRDTLSQASDHSRGGGIIAKCSLDVRACGSLVVEESTLINNRDRGVQSWGVGVTIRSSVVRGTLSQETDGAFGWGIAAQCVPDGGFCGSLTVERSLSTENRGMGIVAWGVDATIRSSVVRDTLPQDSDQWFGRGITSQCDRSVGACGSLTVRESLVSGNRDAGIIVASVDASVFSSVIRDTLEQECDQSGGAGLVSQFDPSVGHLGNLWVEGSLVTNNRKVGIVSLGVKAIILSSSVRDTLPEKSSLQFGRGITAQCYPHVGVCGSLRVTDSLVSFSEEAGVSVFGVPSELSRVAVVDTTTNDSGRWAGEHGQGIWALCDPDTGASGTLTIASCLVASSHGAGVALEGVSGIMTGSVVDSVLAQPKDNMFGYGVQIGGRDGEVLPAFHIQECLIHNARLAGVLYYRAQGTLSGSMISGGEYCVAKNEGSSPTVTDDNQLSCSVRSEPEWVSLYPSPAPPPVTPIESPEE
jgi:hypothetical protein